VEEAEGPGSGSAGAEAVKAPAVDPVAVSLALNGASREEADSFLRKQSVFLDNQSALIADQRHHLHEQLQQIHLDVWEKWLGVLLRVATVIVGMTVAAGAAFLIWNAAHSNELIVDAFSVPPDLAQKGISGEVLAGEVVDRLIQMQAEITTFRAPQSYANTFGESVKLEIPETGVSLTELDRFLREKLGNNTHISGALVRTALGLRLTARIGGVGSDSIEGAESDLDTLVERAADAIYSRTQPFRYATYIWQQGRTAEAHQLFQALANSDRPRSRRGPISVWVPPPRTARAAPSQTAPSTRMFASSCARSNSIRGMP
jgi:hypothetical protein